MAGVIPAGGPAVGWIAAASGLFLPAIGVVAFVRGRSTQRRVASAAMLAPLDQRLGADVRLLRADEHVALSVADNGRGHVVVSCGLVRALTDDQLAAVVRHERAHLRHRHGSYLLMASSLETGLLLHPLVRRSTAVLRRAVERWADEDAAGCSADGRQATRAALLAAVFAENPLGVAGFGPIDTVVDRVAALQRPAPRSSAFARLLATAPLALLVLIAMTSAGMAGDRLWSAIAMPVSCRLGLA